MQKAAPVIPIFFLAFTLSQTSCAGDATSPPEITSIAVSPARSTLIADTGRIQLFVSAAGSNGPIEIDEGVTWSSSDKDIAYMNGNSSLVLANSKLGTATITASVKGKTATAEVIVIDPVGAVHLSPTNIIIPPSGTFVPTVDLSGVSGYSVSGRVVSWTTSNPAVASVDGDGLVTAISLGSATITATSEGHTGTIVVEVRQLVSMGALTSVSTGFWTTCAVNTAGQGFCWGEGRAGQLGNGDTVSTLIPIPIAGGVVFSTVAAGQEHACGLSTTGIAYCWGGNRYGQLGDNTLTPHLTPAPVAGGHTFTSLAVGGSSACGIDATNTAYCWGVNQGAGSPSNKQIPSALNTGNKFSLVSVGVSHNCGITTDGATYCWGGNVFGELGGTASSYSVNSPLYVNFQPPFVTLSAGFNGTCGLVSSGDAYCWGVIPGSRQSSPWPPVGGGVAFSSLRVGDRHVCGVDREGAGYCWGENTNGALGNGSIAPTPAPSESAPTTSVPSAVTGGLSYSFIQAGLRFSCGLTKSGVAYCWGANRIGQLGIGTNNDSGVPAKVTGQP
jgi:alpha-tubulin suppressor-like RCC1 family protein